MTKEKAEGFAAKIGKLPDHQAEAIPHPLQKYPWFHIVRVIRNDLTFNLETAFACKRFIELAKAPRIR